MGGFTGAGLSPLSAEAVSPDGVGHECPWGGGHRFPP